MNHQQPVAGRRASAETLVISQARDGFRIYAVVDPHTVYTVSGTSQQPHCTCPEFNGHGNGEGRICQHILAVRERLTKAHGAPSQDAASAETASFNPDDYEREERRAIREDGNGTEPRLRTPPARPAEMLLKRSVSPDGRIDSLSVEFSCPVADTPAPEIESRAQKMLQLQSLIIAAFLKNNAKERTVEKNRAQANGGNGAVEPKEPSNRTGASGNGGSAEESRPIFAQMLQVAGMDGKWGRRLFLTFDVDGEIIRLFGNKKQLGEAIEAAGYTASQIAEGLRLDVPCQVVTAPSEDGRYTNVVRILPLDNGVRRRA